MDEQGMDMKQ